jgi:hypothetical protein
MRLCRILTRQRAAGRGAILIEAGEHNSRLAAGRLAASSPQRRHPSGSGIGERPNPVPRLLPSASSRTGNIMVTSGGDGAVTVRDVTHQGRPTSRPRAYRCARRPAGSEVR